MDNTKDTKTLIEIDREFSPLPESVLLTGGDLDLPGIVAVARKAVKTELTKDPEVLDRIRESYQHMMQQVEDGVPIYGCNTGYGGQAARILINGSPEDRIESARKISEGIIHVDVSVGPEFSDDVVRAAILIRINMLMGGVSAVKLDDLKIYQAILNTHLTPIVNQYGGIGASGDLAHNGRVLTAARQLKGVKVRDRKGTVKEASKALKDVGIPALELDPKAGLGLVNGDNFSTALAALLWTDTLELLLIANVAGAMMTEALRGSDRSFHPLLANVRSHAGQKEVADIYRYLLQGSTLAYQELTSGHQIRPEGIKVQDGYSLRGISQYHGVNFERMKQYMDVITINANSVSDNPLWVNPDNAFEEEEPWKWVSGGNFLAMYMVEVMDGLRKIITQTVKLNDRHLARLIDVNENNGLPANLSDKAAVTGCAFKGVQIQSGMFDVYSSLLSIPVSTFFGVHEERNQDITAHALTSGILGLDNLRLARYSTAQNLLAVCQAADLREGDADKLSPRTRPMYEFVRDRTEFVEEERPLHQDIEALYESMVSGEMNEMIRKDIFGELNSE